MTALLLCSSWNLQGQIKYSLTAADSTALAIDTTIVSVPVYAIKQANAKMIERVYLLQMTAQQDSIISLKNAYIVEQQDIIADFQDRVATANAVNASVEADLQKQKTKTKVIAGCSCGIVAGLLIGMIAK